MRKFLCIAGLSIGLYAGPASACDLDGMFGPHRFNAFGGFGGQFDPEPRDEPASSPRPPEPAPMQDTESAQLGTSQTTFATMTAQLDKREAPLDVPEKRDFGPDEKPAAGGEAADPSALFR